MNKPRLFIPVTYNFVVRYILRTGLLEKISQFATPVVFLAWDSPALLQEIRQKNGEAYVLPPVVYGSRYTKIRQSIDAFFFQNRLKGPSYAIRQRHWSLSRSWRANIRAYLNEFSALFFGNFPGYWDSLQKEEARLLEDDTNIAEIRAFFRQITVDAGFSVTPFLKEEELFLRVATEQKIPLVASLLSFDNSTTRGWIPVSFQHYMVWNNFNKNQVLRAYPQVSPSQVTVVGAPQFDFYASAEYCWEESRWRKEFGIPDSRPVILYGANSHFFTPNEPFLVEQLDKAIQAGEIPGNPVILLRSHPTDRRERWEPLVKKARHIIFDNGFQPSKYSDISLEDIKRLVSTLKYSQVHINICSTMALDGAFFDKPQIAPAYDDTPGTKYDRSIRELYMAEHYQPIVESGGITQAFNRDELIFATKNALLNPGNRRQQRSAMLESLISFQDGRSADRVAGVLRLFLTKDKSDMKKRVGHEN